jgi:hypothetical protein
MATNDLALRVAALRVALGAVVPRRGALAEGTTALVAFRRDVLPLNSRSPSSGMIATKLDLKAATDPGAAAGSQTKRQQSRK